MTVGALGVFLKFNLPRIREEVLTGKYRPSPVKRVEIPKPGGGIRKLGIPTALDRLIQQALLQVLTPLFDPTFSGSSYGFRPGRGCHDAVRRAKEFVESGHRWVVDIDLEKFFDQVNHDALMARVARKVKDKEALRLIRRFLGTGVLFDGLIQPEIEGAPQGGPLSPLLSNIMLDDLDKELERRGHRFCRYADDCNVYVRSKRAGERLMGSLTRFLEEKLKLKVNGDKSAVDHPWSRQFLGYSFLATDPVRLIVAPDRIKRFKRGMRPLLRMGRGNSLEQTLKRAVPKIRGWVGYFKLSETKSVFENLDKWFRRRMRCILWRHWRRPKRRAKELLKRGLDRERTWQAVHNKKGPWRNAGAHHMNLTVTNRELHRRGLISFLEEFQRLKCSAG